MVVVGGQAPKAIRSVECFDFEEERWFQVAELPSRRCRAGEQTHSYQYKLLTFWADTRKTPTELKLISHLKSLLIKTFMHLADAFIQINSVVSLDIL